MDARLKRYAEGTADPDLEELLFQYARYLMISSSRPGDLPANLQGSGTTATFRLGDVIITPMLISR
jgi:hypothetical protein